LDEFREPCKMAILSQAFDTSEEGAETTGELEYS